MYRLTLQDWQRIASEFYGEPRAWRFRCASCGNVQSGASVREHNAAITNAQWVFSNCEGRHTKGHGCDWTLGGLFSIHTVEVFAGAGPMAVFAFADDEPMRLVAEASAAFVPPVHQPVTAETWAEFEWPDWVPASVRSEIERFWGPESNRRPSQWGKDASDRNAPPLGTLVTLPRTTGDGDTATGRYVHAWNNIGRLIADDGTVAVVAI